MIGIEGIAVLTYLAILESTLIAKVKLERRDKLALLWGRR